jgi:hypothetical protein
MAISGQTKQLLCRMRAAPVTWFSGKKVHQYLLWYNLNDPNSKTRKMGNIKRKRITRK